MATIEEKIAAAEQRAKDAQQQIKQLKAQQQLLENRKLTQLLKGQRAQDTRRKILAGALVLEMMSRDEQSRARFLKHLDGFLTRPDDRALFDLPPLSSDAPDPSQADK